MILCVLFRIAAINTHPNQKKWQSSIRRRKLLRRSDIYTRCSPSQFLVLLMGINQENCRMVSRRIEDTLHRYLKGDNVRLASSICFRWLFFPEEKNSGSPRW